MRALKNPKSVFLVSALFWLLVVGGLGAFKVARVPRPGVFTYTFEWWDATPVGRHLFLGQSHAHDAALHRAYVTYTPFYLVTAYLLLAPLNRLTALPYEVLQNGAAFLFIAVFVALLLLWNRAGLRDDGATPARRRMAASVLAALAVTHAPLWLSLLAFNRDNFHVPTAFLFCHLILGGGLVAYEEWGTWLGLFAPIHVPAWALAGWAAGARHWRRSAILAALVAAISLAIPRLMLAVAGYSRVGSTYLYRSGLDGSTAYVTNLWQAATRPSDAHGRLWTVGVYLLAAAAVGVGVWIANPQSGRPYVRKALLLAIPYLCALILFPQFTSIHPYLTDPLITIPATALIVSGGLDDDFLGSLRGAGAACWLLGAAGLLMTNLLALAQGFRMLLAQP